MDLGYLLRVHLHSVCKISLMAGCTLILWLLCAMAHWRPPIHVEVGYGYPTEYFGLKTQFGQWGFDTRPDRWGWILNLKNLSILLFPHTPVRSSNIYFRICPFLLNRQEPQPSMKDRKRHDNGGDFEMENGGDFKMVKKFEPCMSNNGAE